MKGQNKKESVAALHRESILLSAEQLFLEKGVAATTIDDISRASDYSRRTIYAYYQSKEDIFCHIVLKGLVNLKDDLIALFEQEREFIEQCRGVFGAMQKYQMNSPQSAASVNQKKDTGIDADVVSQAMIDIFKTGRDINTLLADFIEGGKRQGIVRHDVEPMKTVYIMWGSISSLLSLVQSKGEFLEKEFSVSKESFLEYGFRQIINSILEVRI